MKIKRLITFIITCAMTMSVMAANDDQNLDDKMNNNGNKMALDYFLAQMLLKGNLQGFQQYLGLAQQYGGYREMPLGYQDVMRCIQAQGRVPDSPYAKYVQRMMERRGE